VDKVQLGKQEIWFKETKQRKTMNVNNCIHIDRLQIVRFGFGFKFKFKQSNFFCDILLCFYFCVHVHVHIYIYVCIGKIIPFINLFSSSKQWYVTHHSSLLSKIQCK
jgi:hypothetical protein